MSTNQFADFNAIKIKLASPEDIRSWSCGEVLYPETLNYRTFKAVKSGLFCEKIFGPTRDFHCYCGKYKGIRYKGVVCDKCGVEVTYTQVRRERMGHIELASPAAHNWFFRAPPSPLPLILDIPPRQLEAVVYFSRFLVLDADPQKRKGVLASLKKELGDKKKTLRGEVEEKIRRSRAQKEIAALKAGLAAEEGALEDNYKRLLQMTGGLKKFSLLTDSEYSGHRSQIDKFAKVMIGAEAVEKALEGLDLKKLAKNLGRQLKKARGEKRRKLGRRLKIVENFLEGQVDPSWMIIHSLPVIPPDLRPLVQLEGGRFASSDLNDLYRRVLNRNNRLRRLLEFGAPEVIVRNEKRMLQEGVDSLIGGARAALGGPRRGGKELRSLSDLLRGKKGRFRQNLLGKRVDYSGRSVIVVGPHLKLSEVGLPKEMALELFRPFVLRDIYTQGLAPNLRSAKEFLELRSKEVWDLLEKITTSYPVLLNRAPTLHRLSILAFYPKLIEGSAIQLHPCVCSGFNADFDGDAMSVHVPLSKPARQEAQTTMLSDRNLLKPSDGRIIVDPSKDMLLGAYYLTSTDPAIRPSGKIFADPNEALLALNLGHLRLRQSIKVAVSGKLLETTCGRIIFNRQLPQELPFVNQPINKAAVKHLLAEVLESAGRQKTVALIDAIKSLGFAYATRSGVSLGILDTKPSEAKPKILAEAEKRIEKAHNSLRRGLITPTEEKRLSEQTWMEATDRLAENVWEGLEEGGPVKLIIDAGAARASKDQLRQISGMKGLVADPTGRIVELPIRGNYGEGLTGFEYFAGARGARKSLADIALKTAEAGYLTRRLVDVAQDVLTRVADCGTKKGWEIRRGEETLLTTFGQRLIGRVAAADVSGVVKRNELIAAEAAAEIEADKKIAAVLVRSPLTCEAKSGICCHCYGLDLGENAPVEIGAPAGIIAAQSIGEPGTQLTLWTKHAGGIVREREVTQGLPRVEELLEARAPKFKAVVSEVAGKVEVVKGPGGKTVRVRGRREGKITAKEYELDEGAEILVSGGQAVVVGQPLTAGNHDPQLLLTLAGKETVQRYILNEVQKVYATQGIGLADKHIEVIIRQMFSRGEGRLLGITKASLLTDSFLAAASFQNTTKVLTDAAIRGRVDRLRGLKENVIIGRLIPTGERARFGEN